MQRSELELELAKARADIAYYGDLEVYSVDANSLINHFGITEIDGVKIEAEEPLLFGVWD